MDDNTAKVLMAAISLIGAIVTPLVVVWVGRIQGKKTRDKVDAYHHEVNGNMAKLLETTKQLATAQEKARADNEKKK